MGWPAWHQKAGKLKECAETACNLQAAPISAPTGAMRANWDHSAGAYTNFVTGSNVMAPARERILAAATNFAKEHTGEPLYWFPDPLIPSGVLFAEHAISCRGVVLSTFCCTQLQSLLCCCLRVRSVHFLLQAE